MGLRLFAPQHDSDPPPTLRDAWQRWLLPQLERSGRRPKTIAAYQRAVDRFSQWWREERPQSLKSPSEPARPFDLIAAGGKERMGDPLLTQIDRQALAAFRQWFTTAAADGGGGATGDMANKVIRPVEAILQAAADHQEESGYAQPPGRLKPLETTRAAYSTSADFTSNRSFIFGLLVVPSGGKTYRVQHRCDTTYASHGFGPRSNFAGVDEIYTIVRLIKVA